VVRFHVLAALTKGKEPLHPLGARLSEAQSRSGRSEEVSLTLAEEILLYESIKKNYYLQI
jgi:hypothetical protein